MNKYSLKRQLIRTTVILVIYLIFPFFVFCSPKQQGTTLLPGRTPDYITVNLFSTITLSSLTIQGTHMELKSPGGSWQGNRFTLEVIPGTGSFRLHCAGKQHEITSPVKISSSAPFVLTAGDKTRVCATGVQLTNTTRRIIVLQKIPFEEYIAGVVHAELPEGTHEALKAQAIVARSYALANYNRHAGEGFNLCDCTHCQFYRGNETSASPFKEAAVTTRGMVLEYRGRQVEGLYHSTCGGATTIGEVVFGKTLPGIIGVRDSLGSPPVKKKNGATKGGSRKVRIPVLCRHSPHFTWTYTLSGEEFSRILSEEKQFARIGTVQSIEIVRKDAQGRVIELDIQGTQGREHISGYDFWQMMGSQVGWGKFKSAWFTVQFKNGIYTFKGRGLGHGLGLCQYGAMELAKQKKSYRFILRHYFPRAGIVRRSY